MPTIPNYLGFGDSNNQATPFWMDRFIQKEDNQVGNTSSSVPSYTTLQPSGAVANGK